MPKSLFFLFVLIIGLLTFGCQRRTVTAHTSSSNPIGPTIIKVPTDADFAKNPPMTQALVDSIRSDYTYADIKKDLGSLGIQLPGKYSLVFWDTRNAAYMALFKDEKVISLNNDAMHLKIGDTLVRAKELLGKPSSIEDRTPVVWGGSNHIYLVIEFHDGHKKSQVFYKNTSLKDLLTIYR